MNIRYAVRVHKIGGRPHAFEGGISSPLIVSWPKQLSDHAGCVRHGMCHIIDLLPTVLDAADVEFPSLFRGRQPVAPDGESLMEMVKGAEALARPFFYEHQGSRAVYHEGWKLVADGINRPWEQFNLIEDPTEQKDLRKQFPERVSKLKQLWEDWAEQNNVLPLQEGGSKPRLERLRNQGSTEQSGKP